MVNHLHQIPFGSIRQLNVLPGIVIDGGHFDWSASGKFPGFTEPADGYHGMRFWETYKHKALAAKLRMDSMRDLGPCMSPFNAWLFLQGLETLPLRGARHCQTALQFSEWLEGHDCVSWVLYPGLKSHKDYERTKATMPNGAGGVLTFGVVNPLPSILSPYPCHSLPETRPLIICPGRQHNPSPRRRRQPQTLVSILALFFPNPDSFLSRQTCFGSSDSLLFLI